MTGPARVATVAGRPISIERLDERVAEVRRGPRGRHLPPGDGPESTRLHRWIVQELVTEEVLAHEARAAGITGTGEGPDGQAHVPGPSSLSASVVARLVEQVTAAVTVPGDETRAYYERNLDRYRRPESRRVRHILLGDEASARRVAARLAAGDEMAALALAGSIDRGSRRQGGDLGEIHRGEFAGPFEDAIFGAEVGAVVGPIQTEHGWHVAQVEAVTGPSTLPYAEVRPAIEAELLAAARTAAFAAWLDVRRTTLAVIEPEFEHPAHPVHGAPSHRH